MASFVPQMLFLQRCGRAIMATKAGSNGAAAAVIVLAIATEPDDNEADVHNRAFNQSSATCSRSTATSFAKEEQMETAPQELAPPSSTMRSSSPQPLASSEADEQHKETAEELGMESAEEELMETAPEGSEGTDLGRLLDAAERKRARREVEQVFGPAAARAATPEGPGEDSTQAEVGGADGGGAPKKSRRERKAKQPFTPTPK
ncbi:hypothetical protein JKP88DRAFT_350549 [Tribonema minus]|uniref:Uncharacterized protein n=1 Tax=Tribonema minus TaxID=303371 RepID=A0A835YVD7_9STRA|nr:hypothetical protein JKP88DRAFT_350549 [Tribonema minus]